MNKFGKQPLQKVVKNKYKVPKAAWKKFGPKGQEMYNAVRESGSQDVISPMYLDIPVKYWKVIEHNFAFTAAMNMKYLLLWDKVKASMTVEK